MTAGVLVEEIGISRSSSEVLALAGERGHGGEEARPGGGESWPGVAGLMGCCRCSPERKEGTARAVQKSGRCGWLWTARVRAVEHAAGGSAAGHGGEVLRWLCVKGGHAWECAPRGMRWGRR